MAGQLKSKPSTEFGDVFYMSNNPLSILIVDDHELARTGIEMAVTQMDNIGSVVTLCDGREVLKVVQSEGVDIVLLDLNLPDVSGLDVLIQLTAVLDIVVIVVTGENQAKDFGFALKMGVRAVVSKSDSVDCIRAAIKAALDPDQVQPYLSPNIERIMGMVAEMTVSLSPRQIAILHYLSKGETNKEIAYRLGVAAPTVSFHLKELRLKLGVSGNKKILNRAFEIGLLESPSVS